MSVQKVTGQTIIITVVIMLATVMQTLDTTIANVALPHMQSSMNAAQDQITWVLTSYVVASAIGMTMIGYLSERFGTKLVFLFMVGTFTFASMLCAIAQSLPEMVLFRVIQGFAGAGLVPLAQTVILNIYPTEKHASALGFWSMGVILGPIFGPTIGGYLTDTWNWRWCFFINLPIGILCVIGILLFMPSHKKDTTPRFDFKGFAFIAIALASFQLMLDRGETLDWFASLEILIEAGIAGIAFYLFIVHILTVDNPFVNLSLFKDVNFVTGTALALVSGLTIFATMALLPSMLQSLLGYPIIETGYLMMPRGIGTMIAMGAAARLLRYIDGRALMVSGASLTAYSMYLMAGFDLNATPREFVISGVLQGLGLGLFFAPMTIWTFSTLSPALRAQGTSIQSLARNIGSSVGITVVTMVVSRQTQTNHEILSEYITPFSRPLQSLADRVPLLSGEQGLAVMNGMVTRQANMIAYIDAFMLMAIVTAATIPLIPFMRKPKRAPGPAPVEHAVVEV